MPDAKCIIWTKRRRRKKKRTDHLAIAGLWGNWKPMFCSTQLPFMILCGLCVFFLFVCLFVFCLKLSLTEIGKWRPFFHFHIETMVLLALYGWCNSEESSFLTSCSLSSLFRKRWGGIKFILKVCGKDQWEDVCQKFSPGNFPGGPVVKTPSSQCRGPRFDPWSGN